jgi:cobalt-zinc-cadmium resistance protein CzcA
MVGVGIPLFFFDKKARVSAGKISVEIAQEQEYNLQIKYRKRIEELSKELKKYDEALKYYNDFGKNLYEQMILSAQKSYQAGQIDIFKYLQSLETATNIKLDYLYNLWQSNNVVLELNYFTM